MAFLGSIGKTFSRVVTALATSGASEIARATGHKDVANLAESVFAPGINRDTGDGVPASYLLALGGAQFYGPIGAAVGYGIGSLRASQFAQSLDQPPSQQNQVYYPPQQPNSFTQGGGPAFGAFVPGQSTGGNPAWHSLGASVQLSTTPSEFSELCQGGWELRGNSVRRC